MDALASEGTVHTLPPATWSVKPPNVATRSVLVNSSCAQCKRSALHVRVVGRGRCESPTHRRGNSPRVHRLLRVDGASGSPLRHTRRRHTVAHLGVRGRVHKLRGGGHVSWSCSAAVARRTMLTCTVEWSSLEAQSTMPLDMYPACGASWAAQRERESAACRGAGAHQLARLQVAQHEHLTALWGASVREECVSGVRRLPGCRAAAMHRCAATRLQVIGTVVLAQAAGNVARPLLANVNLLAEQLR